MSLGADRLKKGLQGTNKPGTSATGNLALALDLGSLVAGRARLTWPRGHSGHQKGPAFWS